MRDGKTRVWMHLRMSDFVIFSLLNRFDNLPLLDDLDEFSLLIMNESCLLS